MRFTTRFTTRSVQGRHLVAGTVLAALTVAGITGCGGNDGAPQEQALTAAPVASDGGDQPVITVEGVGRVEGTPDLMTLRLGVETKAPAAKQALDDANARMRALLATLEQAGIAKKDLQTSDLSVQPTWDEDGLEITGYVVRNTVTAKLRDLDGAGAVIDAAAGAAGDAVRLDGVSFSIENTSALVAEARTDAVRRAQDQAGQLAEAAGVELGRVTAIDETPADVPQPEYYARAVSADAAGVPIEAGTQELTLRVRVVYEIAD